MRNREARAPRQARNAIQGGERRLTGTLVTALGARRVQQRADHCQAAQERRQRRPVRRHDGLRSLQVVTENLPDMQDEATQPLGGDQAADPPEGLVADPPEERVTDELCRQRLDPERARRPVCPAGTADQPIVGGPPPLRCLPLRPGRDPRPGQRPAVLAIERVDDPRAANPGKVQHERWQRLAPLLQLASPLERVAAQPLPAPPLARRPLLARHARSVAAPGIAWRAYARDSAWERAL